MTHNFDFFRTLKSRLETDKKPKEWLASKGSDGVNLKPQNEINTKNPFISWVEKLKDCNSEHGKHIYAVILLMRNIVDYSGMNKSSLKKLNNLIHGRGDNFETITMSDVRCVLQKSGLDPGKIIFSEDFGKKSYFKFLAETVGVIVKKDNLGLEEKIVVCLFIRMKTEIYLREILGKKNNSKSKIWKMLSDADETDKVSFENISQLKRVNLITPEHIHINSFMYEPLMDLDKKQIVSLYESVIAIVDPKVKKI